MAVSVRHRLYEVMEQECEGDRAAQSFEIALTLLIVANVVAVSAETLPALEGEPRGPLFVFEMASVAIFTVEYLVRLWIAPEDPRYRTPGGRIRYILSWPALIDLVAIAPSLVTLGTVDLRFVRALRLLRVARVLKLGRYSESVQVMSDVLRAKRDQLVSALAVLGILLFVAASLMYFAEHSAQPDLYTSIPMAVWLTIATFGGNLEAPPITLMGRIIAASISILSAGLFALPAGILASGFTERLARPPAAQDSADEGTKDEETD